jgi:predicted nucleotidyltransferase component of viral defense system
MAEEDRLRTWELLFERALRALDSAPAIRAEHWSFGGGTVLMRRYRHRFSKDVDIFLPDPQYLGHLDPDLNDTVDALTANRVKAANYLKLSFEEGEVDFIASGAVTGDAKTIETILGRPVRVESSAEILGKKMQYRASAFTARDLLDFAMLAEKAPAEMPKLGEIMAQKRDAILSRFSTADRILRATFAELELLDYRRSYDECLDIVTKLLRG